MSIAFFENNKKSILLIGLYFLMIVLISFFWPKEIDWTHSFSKNDTKPYGANVLYESLPALFPALEISVADRPIYNTINDNIGSLDGKGIYMIFNRNFYPDSLDMDRLLRFVENGNDVFISAETMGFAWLDTLGIKELSDYEVVFRNSTPLTVGFYDEGLNGRNPRFKDLQTIRHFGCTDETQTRYATSWLTRDSTNYFKQGVQFGYGNGVIHMNSIPTGYTNLHVLDTINYLYAERTLALLSNYDYLIWDEYYKIGKPQVHGSPLREILLVPAFKWAYWITLISTLLYIIFHAKRKQRIIPIIEPYKNNNKEYVETVGSLYYNTSSYKSIIDKKLLYFREYIYKNYKISDLEYNDIFSEMLSEKTLLDKFEIKELFDYINDIQSQEKITAQMLKNVTQKINNFYNKA